MATATVMVTMNAEKGRTHLPPVFRYEVAVPLTEFAIQDAATQVTAALRKLNREGTEARRHAGTKGKVDEVDAVDGVDGGGG